MPAAEMPSPSLKQAAVVALAAAAANSVPTLLASEEPAASDSSAALSDVTFPTRIEAISQVLAPTRLDLHTAVRQGDVTAVFRGNGRDKMQAVLTNQSKTPLAIRVPAGQMFEAGSNLVIVLRSCEVELRPGKVAEVAITTAATRSGNSSADAPYQLSYGTLPRLEALLAYAKDRPEISTAALQTAVLALTENLPLSAVAKFTAAGGDLPTRFDTPSFKADTADILQALITLRSIGANEADLALTIDPQLKIEAMIEPATRSAAMRYYGITAETEWEYWKTELLSGEPTTRHYALYGIARFYPNIALEMLPRWARETKTQNVLRLSAIQALADTHRPEALPILQQLSDELGATSELGRAATSAAKVLSAQLAKLATNRVSVEFRAELAPDKL